MADEENNKVGMDAADATSDNKGAPAAPTPPQQSSFDMAIGYFKLAFQKYADFTGRANRGEYWYFVLVSFVVGMGLSIVDSFIGVDVNSLFYGGLLGAVYSLASFIPSMSVAVRRLHDRNMSGWMLLIALIPLFGPIALIIILAQRGDPQDNKYGSMSRA